MAKIFRVPISSALINLPHSLSLSNDLAESASNYTPFKPHVCSSAKIARDGIRLSAKRQNQQERRQRRKREKKKLNRVSERCVWRCSSHLVEVRERGRARSCEHGDVFAIFRHDIGKRARGDKPISRCL